MARELGTSWQHVDRWEKGRTLPTTDSLRKIASFLGVTVDFLVAGDDVGQPELNDALKEFLEAYAPPDLTGAELEWLRSAPLGDHTSPGRYVDLLQALRDQSNPMRRPVPTRTGSQVKVDRDVALKLAKKSGHE